MDKLFITRSIDRKSLQSWAGFMPLATANTFLINCPVNRIRLSNPRHANSGDSIIEMGTAGGRGNEKMKNR